MPLPPVCPIMGVNVAVLDMPAALALLEEHREDWRGRYVCVTNVHTAVTAYGDPAYRAVQNGAALVLPDGAPLAAYSRRHGFAQAQRVAGPDLFRAMLGAGVAAGRRHYFYGGSEATAAALRTVLPQRYPGLAIAGIESPPFRPLTAEEDAAAVARINAARPDYVWVGLGAPKQENWMAAHAGRIEAVMLGVGAAFDFETGTVARAPKWMQDHSLEWLWRLSQDPGRLLGRYLHTNTKFLLWQIAHK